jgi:hypothetical protein
VIADFPVEGAAVAAGTGEEVMLASVSVAGVAVVFPLTVVLLAATGVAVMLVGGVVAVAGCKYWLPVKAPIMGRATGVIAESSKIATGGDVDDDDDEDDDDDVTGGYDVADSDDE